ncbi:MAG TPA: phytoene/squalene synthase family protein [Methylovirgula sp.]|nr:phytoene/squalene synthase family protein [Methylovirgula sp.]
MDLAQDYAHCDALLKRDDPDRWLACLFLPSHVRAHVEALYAFSLEIARVRQLVSEPMLGEMRFQYWREVLAGEHAGDPVAAALTDTIMRCGLSRDPLLGLIDARLFDLYDTPMPSVAALEAYARATAGNLFFLAASILGGAEERAAEHAGIAYSVTGLLRALPWHVAAGQIYVPLDLLARHGLLPEDLRSGRDKPALFAALTDMRALARRHLQAFFAIDTGKAAPAYLPLALSAPYLHEMDRPGYDPFVRRVELSQWRRLWRLWRAARKIG